MNAIRWRAVVPVLLALALPGVPTPAQNGPISDFQASGEFVLEVAGKDVPKAEIYQSVYASAILVISSELPTPVRINARTQNVEAVNLMKVAKQPDGAITLLPDSTLQPLGAIGFVDDNVVFSVGDKICKLKQRPALLGLHAAADLTAYKPEYVRNEARYTADAATLQALKAQTRPVRVRVFFGSWCPHCTANVPSLIKVEAGLQGSLLHFEYYGLPHTGMADEPEAKKVGVHSVPTGIVYDVAGKELGRIEGDDWRKPEDRLKALLVPAAAK